MASSASKRYWLLTHPRSASNLLVRILNLEAQSTLLEGEKEYFFMPTIGLRFGAPKLCGRHIDTWTPDERAGLSEAYQKSYDSLQQLVSEAEVSQKDIFVKEHVIWLTEPIAETKHVFGNGSTDANPWMIKSQDQTRTACNMTVLPDEFLKQWRPTFLIRHPALMFPSLYRVSAQDGRASTAYRDPSNAVEMSLHFPRMLYDWYCQHPDPANSNEWPIILDADDVITSPDVVTRYASMLGLDSDKLMFTWPTAKEEDLGNMLSVRKKMLRTLHSSEGIMKGKAAGDIDIVEEAKTWRRDFGEEAGSQLEQWVRDAMPDYEYMRVRRLRAD